MITERKLRRAVAWLRKNECGCCHFKGFTDDLGFTWSIVVGWSDGFDDGWKICSKIAKQGPGYSMTCDYDLDFVMPYDIDTGEVFDTDTELGTNYKLEAERLNKEFKEVTDRYAVFINSWFKTA